MQYVKILIMIGVVLAEIFHWFPGTGCALEMDKREKLVAANALGFLLITGWGVANWDYGQEPPRASSEGWFDQNTANGGADKLGHAYTTYVLSHNMAYLCRSWGYSPGEAATWGALSAFGLMGFMEVGDSFSRYGFSHEDMIMNTAGACLGYLTLRYPEVGEKLDFRLEYTPSFDEMDVVTDYENMKFLAAIKLGGFAVVENPVLQYLELHLGYYTRGYADDGSAPRRRLYGGIGINLSRIILKHGYPKTSTALRYVQVPYTSINARTAPL